MSGSRDEEYQYLVEELAGAQATIAHMSEAMSWISGHDRQGQDHLQEMMQASEERDAAEAKLREIDRIANNADWQGFASTPQQFSDFCVSILKAAGIEEWAENVL